MGNPRFVYFCTIFIPDNGILGPEYVLLNNCSHCGNAWLSIKGKFSDKGYPIMCFEGSMNVN